MRSGARRRLRSANTPSPVMDNPAKEERNSMTWRKTGTQGRQSADEYPSRSESYGRMLLLGDAEPPTDYMRNRKLDEAIQRYRDVVKRQMADSARE